MKLTRIDGCTNDIMEIDGKCISKFKEEELRTIVHYLAEKLSHDDIYSLIMEITGSFGECEYGERCETCGDSTYTCELEV